MTALSRRNGSGSTQVASVAQVARLSRVSRVIAFTAVTALTATCAQTLEELAPFPCADDDCPDGFTCLPRALVGDNSCSAAFDGVCDEPGFCDPFTDAADCAALASEGEGEGEPIGDDTCQFANDDECDEPNLCAPGTDASDCGGGDSDGPDSCATSRDGVCDEPISCSGGTDTTDCRSVSFCVSDDDADDVDECDDDGDCNAEDRCDSGACVPRSVGPVGCDLFDPNACGGGNNACSALGSDAAGYDLECAPFTTNLSPGSSCNGNGPTCGPQTTCYGTEADGFICFNVCDDNHPCASGTCVLFPGESFGRCE